MMVTPIKTYRVHIEEMTDDPSTYKITPTHIAANREMLKKGLDLWLDGERKQGDKFVVQVEYKRALDIL